MLCIPAKRKKSEFSNNRFHRGQKQKKGATNFAHLSQSFITAMKK
jgi:hypothetical protein